MIIAGNCSFIDISDIPLVWNTAKVLRKHIDYFRCKVFLGGTRPDRFVKGIEEDGMELLQRIDELVVPVMTEIQTERHIDICKGNVSSIWIGARNCQNYGLMPEISKWKGEVLVKRHPGMTIDETIGMYDIYNQIYNKQIYVIERGINTFDRQEDSRWSPDLKGVIRIKNERPDIFDRLVIDCSHSAGKREYIKDVYNAFKAIGCQHYMFECTLTGRSRTDDRQMLNPLQLWDILNVN